MRTATLTLALLLVSSYAFATIIIVDKNGGGNFISIQSAINAAVTNDTVKVWPGTYFEQVTLNKNITLIGSGYENTVINGNFNPTITMTAGKLLCFQVSSLAGVGIKLSGTNAVVANCVIMACIGTGIYSNTSGSNTSVINCIIVYNGGYGILACQGGCINATNCIARWNGSTGFQGYYSGYGPLNLSFSNGSRYDTQGNQGCIDQDPNFTSDTDFHISEGSPCWNTGTPSLQDPDGSYSDMGYFGGPDCPIYPVVFEVLIEPSGSTINLKAKGRANY